jgi:type VI secretion system protein ImpF
MADLAPQERLLPFLLDRLTDDDPATRMESREKRSISFRQFQRAVLRDLSWLLNTPCKTARDRLDEFPEAAKSVINFGIPDLTGVTQSEITGQLVERLVRNAIIAYEPRIPRDTLTVRVVHGSALAGNTVCVEIRGQIWAQPLPETLFVRTDVDLETGMCNLQDQLHG